MLVACLSRVKGGRVRADLQQMGQCQGVGGQGASAGGLPRCTPLPLLHHSTPAYHVVGTHIQLCCHALHIATNHVLHVLSYTECIEVMDC